MLVKLPKCRDCNYAKKIGCCSELKNWNHKHNMKQMIWKVGVGYACTLSCNLHKISDEKQLFLHYLGGHNPDVNSLECQRNLEAGLTPFMMKAF